MRRSLTHSILALWPSPPIPLVRHRRPHLAAGGAVLAGMLAAAPASAQLSDTLHPFVRLGYNHENNLLRLSEGDRALVGDGDGSDNFRTVTAGVALERPIGRQVVTANASVSRVAYDHYTQYDYTGKQVDLDWAWRVGNHFSGHVGGLYSQSLSAFSDFRTDERNLRTERRAYGDGAWLFHPSWQVVGSYSETRYNFELEQQRFNNRVEKLAATGFDYLAPSGSTFGLRIRRLEGDYPAAQFIGIDNGYTQDEQKLNVDWIVSGTTRLTFLGGFVQRKHNTDSVRDDSGTDGRLIVNWAPRERLRFNAQLWREFVATEGAFINNAISKGAMAGATWQVAAKVSVDGQYRYTKRDFAPFSRAGVAPVGASSDIGRTLSASVKYRPRASVELALGAFRDTRSGSEVALTNSFRATGVSFSATAKF